MRPCDQQATTGQILSTRSPQALQVGMFAIDANDLRALRALEGALQTAPVRDSSSANLRLP
eukprot:3596190-Prymnesium_polylepis.2